MNTTQKNNILFIDDDTVAVAHSKSFLEKNLNVIVDIAHDGEKGLEMIATQRKLYDLVILEILVPKLNGVDLCESLCRNPKLRHIPVMLVSILPVSGGIFARSLKQHELFSMVRGVLEKPFTQEELVEKIVLLLS